MRKLLIALVMLASPAAAATRWASPTGSGTACTIASPCSPDYCISEQSGGVVNPMVAGDTCVYFVGTYTDPATISSALSCGAGASACTLRVETAAECTSRGGSSCSSGINIIRTTNCSTGTIELTNADNWTISGIKVTTNAECRGFYLLDGNNLNVTDCTVLAAPDSSTTLLGISGYSGSTVTSGYATNVTVTNFYGRHDPTCTSTGDGRGYNCTTGTDGDDCDFTGPDGSGTVIDIRGYVGATVQRSFMGYMRNIGTFRNMTNFTYKRNWCENSVNHGCIDLMDVDTATIQNNVNVFRNDGFCSDDHNGGDFLDTYCAHNVTISNNTMAYRNIGPYFPIYQFDTGAEECGAEAGGTYGPNVPGLGYRYANWKFYNNIVFNGGGISPGCLDLQNDRMGGTQPRWTGTHNLYADCGANQMGYPDDSTLTSYANWLLTDVDGDGTREEVGSSTCTATLDGSPVGILAPTCALPSFVAYTSGSDDLRPASSSASQVDHGINSGSTLCPTEDYAGNTRPQGAGCDIGAYEFVTTAAACGNSIIDLSTSEVCDGSNLNGHTCATEVPGSVDNPGLACASDCLSFVTTGCTVATVQSATMKGVVLRGGTIK